MKDTKKGSSLKDIDFEIRFYEKILTEQPDFIEALMALGDLYTKRGLTEKGLAVDQKLAGLRPDDPVVLYNLACSYSLLNDIDRSLKTIRAAVRYGYNDFEHLIKDQDLKNLRNDRRFSRFLEKVRPRENR